MLGSFSTEALQAYTQQVIDNSPSIDFSEGDTYDFTRCVRSDGSAYGTGGKCRKGSEEAKADVEKSLGKVKAKKSEMLKSGQSAKQFDLNANPSERQSVAKKMAQLDRMESVLKKTASDLANKADVEKRQAKARQDLPKLKLALKRIAANRKEWTYVPPARYSTDGKQAGQAKQLVSRLKNIENNLKARIKEHERMLGDEAKSIKAKKAK